MTPEQALLYLKQMLIARPGLSVDDCANVAAAWHMVFEAIKPKPQTVPPKEENAGN